MTDLVSQLVGALNRLYVAAPTGLECNSFHHSKGEFHSHSEPCKPAAEYVEALAQARAAITAAKAGGWVAIETAPKDGTAVLVSEGRFCSCVEWNEEFDWWAVDDNKLGPFRLRGAAPTHWQPLPNPPKEQSAGGPGSVDAVADPLSPT